MNDCPDCGCPPYTMHLQRCAHMRNASPMANAIWNPPRADDGPADPPYVPPEDAPVWFHSAVIVGGLGALFSLGVWLTIKLHDWMHTL